MDNPLVSDTLKQFRLIMGAVRQHARAMEQACGISGAQVWMLHAIATMPEVTVSGLSRSLSIHVSTASNMLDKLDRAGWVERVRSDHDRRVVHLRLTAAGQSLLDSAPKPLTGPLRHALENMPGEQVTQLHDALAGFLGYMGHVDRAAAGKPLTAMLR